MKPILNFMEDDVIGWLLESDPAIRWQTKKDLLKLPKKEYQRDQEKISKKGWGKQLLDLQDPEGTWGGGLYSPKYISTHYTLLLLRRFGMIPNEQTTIGCNQLVKMRYIGGVEHPKKKWSETCITGMVLGIISHFNTQIKHFDPILNYLEENQFADGGWNCRYPRTKTTHSSVHTTLSVLEGLHELKSNYPKYQAQVESLREPAHEFLLAHQLYKSHRTGEVIHQDLIEISFPPRWKYNILSALDYFRSTGHPYDDRMKDAFDLVLQKEKKGYWYKGKQMSGKKFFSLNKPRKPSEWNTLRALRVKSFYKARS